jgi:hypothetical protein
MLQEKIEATWREESMRLDAAGGDRSEEAMRLDIGTARGKRRDVNHCGGSSETRASTPASFANRALMGRIDSFGCDPGVNAACREVSMRWDIATAGARGTDVKWRCDLMWQVQSQSGSE